jgi:hypothetical protein
MCFRQQIRDMGAYQSLLFLGLESHLRQLNINPGLMVIEPNIVCTRQRRRKREPQTRLSRSSCNGMALTGAGYGGVWEHPFDEVPRHDERRFLHRRGRRRVQRARKIIVMGVRCYCLWCGKMILEKVPVPCRIGLRHRSPH